MAQRKPPWEQQRGESADTYAKFLHYVNLGPARSLAAAFQVWQGERRKTTKRDKASADWYADSKKWGWPARAREWDIHTLKEASIRTAAAMTDLMNDLIICASRAVRAADVTPSSPIYKDALTAYTVLSAHSTIEHTARLGNAGPGRPERPADSRPRIADPA